MFKGQVLKDCYGRRWVRSPNYQERDVNGPGWLEFISEGGKTADFTFIVQAYGFEPSGGGEKYLHVLPEGSDAGKA